jgi:putative exporter of polyketide antibiotics
MISRKHIRRIQGYTEELVNLFKFFDAQSYILLAVMMVLGIAIRLSGLVPDPLIALFYSGLGLALITAAIYYTVTYIAVCDELLIKTPR